MSDPNIVKALNELHSAVFELTQIVGALAVTAFGPRRLHEGVLRIYPRLMAAREALDAAAKPEAEQ